MFLLSNENVILFTGADNRKKKIVKRYLHYVFTNIPEYCTYSELDTIIYSANKKVKKYLTQPLEICYNKYIA